MYNQLNSNEWVGFNNEQLLYNKGVSYLFVQFETDTNSSSAVASLTTVTAYDSSNNDVTITLTDKGSDYFTIQYTVYDSVI